MCRGSLRLACHEGYPGHHVQFMLIDDELAGRRGWREFELTPAFGRHLLVTEGAAEAGAEMAFPLESRVALYRDVLLPIAGLPPQDAGRIATHRTHWCGRSSPPRSTSFAATWITR